MTSDDHYTSFFIKTNDNGSNEHDGAYWYRDIHWNDGIERNSGFKEEMT